MDLVLALKGSDDVCSEKLALSRNYMTKTRNIFKIKTANNLESKTFTFVLVDV